MRADEHGKLRPGSQAGASASGCPPPPSSPLSPPPPLALPVTGGGRDVCKLQVTGQGTPKLVGISYGPEGRGW